MSRHWCRRHALSKPLEINIPVEQVNRDTLLEAMKGLVIGSSEIKVVYSRSGVSTINQETVPVPPH
jgi:hypothetical protein